MKELTKTDRPVVPALSLSGGGTSRLSDVRVAYWEERQMDRSSEVWTKDGRRLKGGFAGPLLDTFWTPTQKRVAVKSATC